MFCYERPHLFRLLWVNTLRPRQNGRHFADDVFKRIFLNENVWISITISLKFVLKGPINNIPSLVQIMAWRRSGDKPLSEPTMESLLTHICVTRPQWVDHHSIKTDVINLYSVLHMHICIFYICIFSIVELLLAELSPSRSKCVRYFIIDTLRVYSKPTNQPTFILHISFEEINS